MKLKRIMAMVLCFAMVLSTMSFSVFAEDAATEGTWGGIDWTLSDDGTLTITPTENEITTHKQWNTNELYARGEVPAGANDTWDEYWTPWNKGSVKKLVIEDGVTSIGTFAFMGMKELDGALVIPYTVTYIGMEAFKDSTMTDVTFAKVPDGQTGQDLCIAQGAFKGLIVEDFALPADRNVHVHVWQFINSAKLKNITFPATLTGVTSANHVDYLGDPNKTNGGGSGSSCILDATNSSLETITFGNQAVRDLVIRVDNSFIANYGDAYIASSEGSLTYCKSLAVAVEHAQSGDAIVLLKGTDEAVELPEGVTLDKNGFTADNVKEAVPDPAVDYVAMIGSQGYETFDEAYQAAQNGDTIVLLETAVINNMMANYNKTVTIKAEGLDTAFIVKDSVKMCTFSGMTVETDGICITFGEDANGYGPTVDINGGTYNGGVSAIKVIAGLVRIADGTFSATGETTIDADVKNVNANGGKYDFDPTAYVPANRLVAKGNDGFWTVAEAAAQIGETKYADLASAINAAQAGETVTLLRNINLGDITSAIIISKNNITIDGKGYRTITINSVNDTWNNAAFAPRGPIAYTFKNLTIDLKNAAPDMAAFSMKYGGTLENVTVKGAFGKAVDVSMAYPITVTDCTFDGVAVGVNAPHSYAPYSTVTITGTTFNTTDAAAVLYENAVFTDNIIASGSYVQASGYLDVSKNFWNGNNATGNAPAADQLKGDEIICDTYYAANNNGVLSELRQNGVAETPVIRVEIGDETYEYGPSKLALLSELLGSNTVAGAKITLLDNVTLENGIQVAAFGKFVGDEYVITSKTVEIDLGTYTLTGFIQINGNVTATIKNGTVNNTNSKYAAIDVTGTATLEDMTVTSAGKTFKVVDGAALIVKQGTYSSDPTEYVADGYEAVDNGDGTYGVKEFFAAKIGDVEYKTLAAAIIAAQPNDTIILLADVTEDVSIDKNITIDGGNFKYTGNISVSGNTTAATVKNVNFVNGTGYAITTNRIKSITVEDCTVNNYGYGFLYANKSTPTVVVKNVTVDGGNYGFHWVYGTSATLENVTMSNVTNGLLIQNYAGKTVTLKNCNLSNINIWEREGSSGVQTFMFEGSNTVSTLSTSQYAKYVLAAVDATLTAPEGSAVTTNLDGYFVKYVDGAYKAAEAIAQIGDVKYESLAEAFAAGGDIVLLKDVALENGITVNKDATLDLNGKTVSMSVAATTTNALITNNGTLTIKDDAGNGKLTYVSSVVTTNYSTSTIINNGTLTVESGTVENTSAKGGAPYAIDNYNTLTVNGGTITANGNAIRQAQFGNYDNTVTINGGSMSGYAGLQLHVFSTAKKTETVINGGELNGDYVVYTSFYKVEDSANTEITINDGTFNGDYALYLYNSKTGASEYAFDAEIKGGTFNGEVYVYVKDAEGTTQYLPVISGGTYTTDVSANIADGFKIKDNGDGTYGIQEETVSKTTVKSDVVYLYDYVPVKIYPGNITLYRLGIYAAADSADYDSYGFEITVDGENPVCIEANKYGSALNVVVAGETKEITAEGLNYDGSENVCIFGQIIAFPSDCDGADRIKFRPYVVDNGEIKWGYTFTLSELYTKN